MSPQPPLQWKSRSPEIPEAVLHPYLPRSEAASWRRSDSQNPPGEVPESCAPSLPHSWRSLSSQECISAFSHCQMHGSPGAAPRVRGGGPRGRGHGRRCRLRRGGDDDVLHGCGLGRRCRCLRGGGDAHAHGALLGCDDGHYPSPISLYFESLILPYYPS